MVETSRRAVLQASGVAATAALGGCLFGNGGVSGGRLFVENNRPSTYRLEITVTKGRDKEGTTLVEGWYRVPADHALQFAEVIEPDTAYTVTVHRETVPEADSVTVTIPTCDEDTNAGRDVSVRVQRDGMGIIPQGCGDESYDKLDDLEYVTATDYQIDPP